MEHVVWGISGAAARAIGLFEAANVSMERGEKPTIIIGNSSGALLAPIIAASYGCPDLMESALEFARTLDPLDMFPYKNNKPFNKKGKPTFNAIMRIIGGHSHLGWQDIKPLYKKVFKQEHFEAFKKQSIKCIAFGVDGETGKPEQYILNDATSLDNMIDLIEQSSRIVPFVQSKNGKIDGGFVSFNPAMWILEAYDIKQLVTIYSNELDHKIKPNKNWNKSIISTVTQTMLIATHFLGVKDAIIEQLYCELKGIDYLRIECPNGYTDEIYESDDWQLKAFGAASRLKAIEKWTEYNTKNDLLV